MGELTYLIRYGVMSHVGRFRRFRNLLHDSGALGEIVVIQGVGSGDRARRDPDPSR